MPLFASVRVDGRERLRDRVEALLQMQRELLLAELAHQRGLLLDQDQLAAVDHADAVGHLLGFFDVMRGEDDGDARTHASPAPGSTCPAAA